MPPVTTTELSLEHTRTLVDAHMRALFTERRQRAALIHESYAAFWDHIAEVAMAGGKRIRPYLTMVGNGGFDERVLPVALAQEFIHIAMLVHDDIIDQDTMRHGVKNLTGRYIDSYSPHTDPARAHHYANSAALLGGDSLISEAYRLIETSDYPHDVRQKLSDQLATSIFEVIGGELLDVEAGFISGVPYDPLTVYRYKTSSYSFIGPLLSGAYCAGADNDTLATLERFATNMGVAFQIQDDLLGVFGDEQQTGKSTTSDLREGKQTLLVRYHTELMTPDQHERFTWFGRQDATEQQLQAIKADMTSSGARQKTIDLAEYYFAAAHTNLAQLPSDARTAELTSLITQLEGRNV